MFGRPQLFHHDVVAGVLGLLLEEGQRWGTMLYDWEAHRRRLDLVENENGTYMCTV